MREKTFIIVFLKKSSCVYIVQVFITKLYINCKTKLIDFANVDKEVCAINKTVGLKTWVPKILECALIYVKVIDQ